MKPSHQGILFIASFALLMACVQAVEDYDTSPEAVGQVRAAIATGHDGPPSDPFCVAEENSENDSDRDGWVDNQACDNCNQNDHVDPYNNSTPAAEFENSDQSNVDGDRRGDICDPCPNDITDDYDGDGICQDVDNCPAYHNPNQEDADQNGIGDACEFGGPVAIEYPDNYPDRNGNGISSQDEGLCQGLTVNVLGTLVICSPLLNNMEPCDNYVDNTAGTNTPATCNTQLSETNVDRDLDLLGNARDNCDDVHNPDQLDSDDDGEGDACDATPFGALVRPKRSGLSCS